jgi:hypothetical protein
VSLISPLLPVWPSPSFDKNAPRVAAPRGVFRPAQRTLAPVTEPKPRAALPVGVAFVPSAR